MFLSVKKGSIWFSQSKSFSFIKCDARLLRKRFSIFFIFYFLQLTLRKLDHHLGSRKVCKYFQSNIRNSFCVFFLTSPPGVLIAYIHESSLWSSSDPGLSNPGPRALPPFSSSLCAQDIWAWANLLKAVERELSNRYVGYS